MIFPFCFDCANNDVPITQKEVRRLFSYNKKTGILRWKHDRANGAVKRNSVAGYVRNGEYVVISINGIKYYAHHLIWLGVYGYIPENEIDHKDRVKYHNWLSNLRESSRSCNMRNTKVYSTNTSGVKGVSFNKNQNDWEVYIWVNKKRKYIGRFKDFDEAVCHRLAAEQCLDWNKCDLSSSAYNYVKENIL